MFTDTELAQIKEAFEAIPNWATVSWCPEGERMLFTITPTIDIIKEMEQMEQMYEIIYIQMLKQ